MKLNNHLEDSIIDETSEEVIPFKYSITSYGADFPVDSLVNRLDKDFLFVPEFQRQYVWTIRQASRFIESLLLGLPVPGIFLSKDPETQKLLIIDGQQRLKTLQFFYNGLFEPDSKEFRLKGVQPEFEEKNYKELKEEDKIRLNDSIIHATIVKQDKPSEDESSIYHIFERLNTGGTSLQPQEIRSCIYQGDFNDFLHELNNHPAWRKVYGRISNRLKDEELILRFFALYFNFNNYKRPLKDFLNNYMAGNRHLKIQNKKTLESVFIPTIDFIARLLGKKAFRMERGLVAAVFDSIMIGVAKRLSKGPIKDEKEFIKKYEKLIQNEDYLNFVQSGTSDKSIVGGRIELSSNIFNDIN